MTRGIFTSPVPGIYHFQLFSVKDQSAEYLDIFLQLNGVNVGLAETARFATGSRDALSLSASLRLETNDTINLYKTGGALYDDYRHFTHFSGWLVDEDLI